MTAPPLAERLRPQTLDELVGQPHLVGNEGFISRTIKKGHPLSIILWGPPGCGKTSIARMYAQAFNMRFKTISAIFSGIGDLKRVIKDAETHPLFGNGTLLFVDEIHRFNKSQQDAFLPFLEQGTIVLVGATVENPSFYLNNALLSRVRVLELQPLNEMALSQLLDRYEKRVGKLRLDKEAREFVIQMAQGDGRYFYNLLENIEILPGNEPLNVAALKKILQKRPALYDKSGEQHYNLISALHKSVRGSDPDAALYWFARMLEGGEDPLFLARRIIRMASEDIGLADPSALGLAIDALNAYRMLGSPEGELALAEAVVYLALAPKSNSIYTAYGQARELAKKTSSLPPPSIILNAQTRLMKELGYGKGYQYDHDMELAFSGQNYFPDGLQRQDFYHPVERGFEREMQKRIRFFQKLREKKNLGKT